MFALCTGSAEQYLHLYLTQSDVDNKRIHFLIFSRPNSELKRLVVAVTVSEKSYKAASDFGHTLFKYYLENNERPNSVISPISVFLCLTGLKQGAGGVTKAELVEALCLSVKGSGNEGQDVLKTLKSRPDDFNFSLNIANFSPTHCKFHPAQMMLLYPSCL